MKIKSQLIVVLGLGALAAYGVDLQKGWYTEDGQQLFPLKRVELHTFGGGAEGHNLLSAFNSTAKGESSPVLWKGAAGSWYQADLRAPDTQGTLTCRLNKVIVHLGSLPADCDFDLHMSEDAKTWVQIGKGKGKKDAEEVATFSVKTGSVNHIRITKRGEGWFKINEIDLFGTISPSAEGKRFVHPGTVVSPKILAEMKKRVTTATHPLGITLEELASKIEPKVHLPQPVVSYYGPSKEKFLSWDGEVAWSHALAWVITEKEVYAENVVKICRAWAETNKDFGDSDPALHVGLWVGALIQAADLVKGMGYKGWTEEVDKAFCTWIDTVCLPLAETQLQKSNSHGNWSCLTRRTAMAYSVFKDDRYQLNRLIELHKMQFMDPKAAAPWGEINETCRTWPPSKNKNSTCHSIDTAHLQMGVSGYVGCAEIAKSQGIDLYGWAEEGKRPYNATTVYSDADFTGARLSNIYEYTAQVLLKGNAVKPYPANIYPNPNWPGKYLNGDGTPYEGKTDWTGNFWGWELMYRHFVVEKNVKMPHFEQIMKNTRATGRKWDGMAHSLGYFSLTHGEK